MLIATINFEFGFFLLLLFGWHKITNRFYTDLVY